MVRKNFARFAPNCPGRKADPRAELIEALVRLLVRLPLPEGDQVIRDFRNRVEKLERSGSRLCQSQSVPSVVLVFSDDHKRISARLSEVGDDLDKGRLAIGSPLGKAILGAEEGDEVDLLLESGRQRKVLIQSVEKSSAPVAAPLGAAGAANTFT